MEKVFVDINDANRTIFNYIGSENFEKAISVLDLSNGKNSFIAGLAIAMMVIIAECPQYIAQEKEK